MISIVIPTLNEASNLPTLLRRLHGEDGVHEVIVVDGGSEDGTADIVRAAGAAVLHTEAGRGQQLRQGIAATTGDVLLLLHADSEFPAGGLGAITAALQSDPDLVGGNFRLQFDGDRGFSHWLTSFYAWIRARGLYYGDSAIFVRRDVYDAIGGISSAALMEDFDFTRRLEATGRTCCIDTPPLITSSRRFEGRSAAAIVLGWLFIHALYYLGVAPDRLARLYNSERRGPNAAILTWRSRS